MNDNKTAAVRDLMHDHAVIKTEPNFIYGCACYQAGYDSLVRVLTAQADTIEKQRQQLETFQQL